MTIDNVVLGLQKIKELLPDAQVVAEHDEIYSGHGLSLEGMKMEDINYLEKHDWEYCNSLDCWII